MNPTIKRGPAAPYAATGEIIREIYGNGVGCLISVRETLEGLTIELYRVDDGIKIVCNGVVVPGTNRNS